MRRGQLASGCSKFLVPGRAVHVPARIHFPRGHHSPSQNRYNPDFQQPRDQTADDCARILRGEIYRLTSLRHSPEKTNMSIDVSKPFHLESIRELSHFL